MRIVIAGAGLAGLSLATGLARDGHDVCLLETDRVPDSRAQGYRLHLDRRGLRALEQVLPPAAYQLVEATSGQFTEPRRLTVLSGRLQRLRTVATGPSRVDGHLVSTAVDRGTLRAILAWAAREAGVEIRWETWVVGYAEHDDQVQVDTLGGAVTGDLLVGADGAASRVARQRLTHRQVTGTGAVSIVGRTPLDRVPEPIRQLTAAGYVVLRGVRTGVGLGLMRFATPPDRAGRSAGVPLPDVPDYVMWNVSRSAAAAHLSSEAPELLHRKAVRRVRTWHPAVRELIAQADPEHTFPVQVLQAGRLAEWQPSRVTVVGDAAHVMPPDRGSGANLALADAARLATALRDLSGPPGAGASTQPDNSERAADLLAAIGRAERAMVEQAFAVSEAGPTVGPVSGPAVRPGASGSG